MSKVLESIGGFILNFVLNWIIGILKLETKVRTDNKEIQDSRDRYERELESIINNPDLSEKEKNELIIKAGREYINRRRGWYTNGSL